MKKIALLIIAIMLLGACTNTPVETTEPVETETEPVRLSVSDEAYLVSYNANDVHVVEPDETYLFRLENFSLLPVEPYFPPLIHHAELGDVYLEGTTLKSIRRDGDTALTLAENVQETKAGFESVLVKQADTNQLLEVAPNGSVEQITTLEAEQALENLLVINQGTYLVENDPTAQTFKAIKLDEDKETVDITGQAILPVPGKDAVLFWSDEQEGKLGQLDLASGDTTWFNLGAERTSRLVEPRLIDDQRILAVYDNQGQAELVLFNLVDQVLKATKIGPAGEFIKLVESPEGMVIHTKSKIYRSSGESMDYFEYTADQVIPTENGLILINNNNVRLIKNNSFKDYQFAGKVADARLSIQQLIVLYASPEGRTLTTQKIDF